jgi:hypothetical protein
MNGQGSFTRIGPTKGLEVSESIFIVGDIGISVSGANDSSGSDYLRMWKKGSNKWTSEIIDTVGYLYGSELFVFSCVESSEYLVLCASENEFYTDYALYYVLHNTITKVGPLPIQNDCENIEKLSYPVDKLKFQNHDNEILIQPLFPFMYDTGDNNWQKFKPTNAYLILDKKSKRLKMHKR